METSKVMTCWECEAATSRPMSVSLATPAGDVGPLTLCPSCYQTYYLPLIAEASVQQAPRTGTPRQHRTHR